MSQIPVIRMFPLLMSHGHTSHTVKVTNYTYTHLKYRYINKISLKKVCKNVFKKKLLLLKKKQLNFKQMYILTKHFITKKNHAYNKIIHTTK